jgi:hypothetical protein
MCVFDIICKPNAAGCTVGESLEDGGLDPVVSIGDGNVLHHFVRVKYICVQVSILSK